MGLSPSVYIRRCRVNKYHRTDIGEPEISGFSSSFWFSINLSFDLIYMIGNPRSRTGGVVITRVGPGVGVTKANTGDI